ncbi:MAG: HRDC domain-containing protein, partial [Legionellales bacterium]|nr:HRDC domain-containing protein [Legionellales bacterium]
KKLTELKEKQDQLQDELDEFDRVPEKEIKRDLDESLQKREDLLNQISKSLKDIEAREKEISKPFDKRIEKLGLDKFSTKEQSDIYDRKLAAVKKSLELDEEFDDLVSGEKLAKLIRREQEKNRDKRRKFYFNLHMEQLMELQDRDGFVYWDNSEEGKANLFNSKRGRIDYKDGKYMFTPENEEPFLVNEANKELYENQIKPGKESEWEEHKNNINKKNKKQLEESKKEVGTLLTKLNELNEKKKSLTSSVHSKRIFNTSTVRRSNDQIEELDTNDTLRKGLIKELNRLNKILNRPVFDNTLTGKEIDNQELLINIAIDKEVASLDTSIREIQEEVGKDEKGEPQFTGTLSKAQLKVSKLEDQINKLPIPNRLKMYTVTDNEDGSFTVFQNINAVKEESISLTDTKLNEKYYKDDKGRHSIIGKDTEHNENTEVFEMLSPADLRFEKLKEFRKKLGKPINVAKNETLMEMAEKMPKTESEFLKIKGIGKVKNEKYGKQFLEFIA